jgi:hypothetical protein
MDPRPVFDLTLPHEYEVDLAQELPGSGQGVIYHPGASRTSGQDGLRWRFEPVGAQEWLGCFAFGHPFPSYSLTGVLATPNVHYACVMSRGTAYWVNARQPTDCRILHLLPVLNARILAEQKLVLLSDFVTLALVGDNDELWRSSRLCWDDLRILRIEDGIVSGVGYDPTNSHTWESAFRVDLKTRTVLKSGYPPELGTL